MTNTQKTNMVYYMLLFGGCLASWSIIAIVYFLAGCGDYDRLPKISPERPTFVVPITYHDGYYRETTRYYTTVNIEGCEYIYVPSGNATVMFHKGNCTNLIHVYRSK